MISRHGTWLSTYDPKHSVHLSGKLSTRQLEELFWNLFPSKDLGPGSQGILSESRKYNRVTNLAWKKRERARKPCREIGHEGLEGRESGGGGKG